MSSQKPTELQLGKGRDNAEARAEAKAARAAKLGMRLPKKKKGWERLRDQLLRGTLMPSLRKVALKPMPGSMDKGRNRQSHVADQFNTFADLAAQISLGQSFAVSNDEAKKLMMESKTAHHKGKKRREEREIRRKLIRKQKKLERELEYLNFPTILGWYFDGFFTPYFQLNEEYATIFNEMELEISKRKESSIKETFAEKAKRYFWPPEVLAGLCFRTRGIYLDLEDILKDPPHTPPDLVLDQRVEAVTLFMGGDTGGMESKVPSDEEHETEAEPDAPMSFTEILAEEDKVQHMMKLIENSNMNDEEKAQKKKMLLLAFKKKKEKAQLHQQIVDEMRLKSTGKNDFYFDDQVPGFFKKRPKDRDKYYFDSQWDVWRKKRNIIHFPNDYYWDEQLALFFPKDRTRPPDYYLYDPALAVYRVAGESSPPNWRGVKPSDFFFDHAMGKWIKKSKAGAGQVSYLDQYGQRYCINKSKDIPDDFYFDVATQQFERKEPDGKLYFFDPSFGAWRKKETHLPGKGSMKPNDFYWNENEYAFKKKDAPSSFFVWDQNNCFFRKKKSLHGKFHPKNWTWNEKKKKWELKKGLASHIFVSQSLYWRPDRDYDKPWLEYVGGYRDFHLEYEYEEEEDPKKAATVRGTPTAPGVKADKKLQLTVSEPALKKPVTPTTSENKPMDMKEAAKKRQSTAGSVKIKEDGSKASSPSQSDTLQYVDTLDRKTLKVTGLGLLTDTDLRKYFGSVKKVVRPKIPGTELEEDYAYLKFKTDEAAAAALRTMHEQDIKGTHISLAYKLKAEDETVGGKGKVGMKKQTPSKN